jgi:hypothetical protein
MKIKATIVIVTLMLVTFSVVTAQGLNDVPGKIVYWRTSPSTLFGYAVGPNRIYTASPSIVKLPNGDYLLSFNLFGSDMNPSAEVSGTTYIYRSSDKGNTWSAVSDTPMSDMKRGSLFVKDGVVYIWGFKAAPGQVIIRKSTDNGLTWSAATELTTETRGGTPFNPVIMNDHQGVERVWFPVGGKRLMSGKSDASLIMAATNWTKVGNNANSDNQPDFGTGVSVEVISEAQIVNAPHTGLVIMPKVEMKGVGAPYFSYTVLLRKDPSSNNTLQDATTEDWVALPGAEKKFAASYDSVSGKFYVLSNPVLPAHETNSKWTWQLIRNTAAIISSRDLRNWDVEQLFLYSKNIDYEGFQYLNFDFDGDDMIVASRTAFDITNEPGVNNKPPRGHDSNMITFHKITNFRETTPDFFLTYSGNKVFRHEQTQHAAAPLGSFANGDVFDGLAFGTINGFAQDVDGDVYISEERGRILRFDALGNFKETVTVSPATMLQTEKLTVKPPAYGERTYIKTRNGNWTDLSNWFYWGRPDTDYEVANLGSAITSNSTITIDKPYSMRGVRFLSTYRYTLAGAGEIKIKSQSGAGILEVNKGNHTINISVSLESHIAGYAANHTGISFNGPFKMNGNDLFKKGSGKFELNNRFVMDGGSLVLDGLAPIVFTSSAVADLNGKLKFEPDSGIELINGSAFQLIEGVESLKGVFSEVILPVLSDGLRWDLSTLYTDGKVSITDGEETSIKGLTTANKDIKVYPNPFSDELTIELKGNKKKANYLIINASGQLVAKGEIIEKTPINTSKFYPGVYIIKAENEKIFELYKLIKN